MPIQTGQNVSVRYKVQSGLGSAASGAGGKELPLIPSAGLRVAKVAIQSPEVRADGMTSIGRHGSRSVAGELGAVVRVGALDELFEALFRSTWVPSFTITEAAMTSITTTTSTIVAASGSWITGGVKVGDVVTLTGHATAANNDKRLPVLGVSASTITVPAGSLTLDGLADTAFTLTVHKRLAMGTTPRYFTVEEYHQDIDQSELFTDCMVSSCALSMQADATLTATFGFVGRDGSAGTTGASPVLTGPTQFGTANLVATDAQIIYNGAAITTLTGLDLSIDLGAATQPVVGATTSPDVFPNNARVSGSLSLLRADLSVLESFLDEDELSLMVVFREPESDPKDFFSVYVPLLKLMESPSGALGGDGPMVSTLAFEAGKKPATAGYVETIVQLSTSAA